MRHVSGADLIFASLNRRETHLYIAPGRSDFHHVTEKLNTASDSEEASGDHRVEIADDEMTAYLQNRGH